MKKGQISIDLLITLVAAIITVTAIMSIMLTYSEAQERSAIQQQLQYTAEKTASIITASQILDDTDFTITLQLSKINYVDEKKSTEAIYPEIIYDPSKGTTLSASTTIKGQTQTALVKAYKSNPANKNKGVSYSNTTGQVVITNEKK